MLAILILLISASFATSTPSDDWNATRLVIRGAAETWDDAGITSNYGMGGIGLGLGLVQPVWGPLAVDVEFTYNRLREGGKKVSTEEYKGRLFQIIPVSVLVEYRAPLRGGRVELFAGMGPAVVAYAEDQQREDYMEDVAKALEKPGLRTPGELATDDVPVSSVIRGARPSFEVRGGLRIDPGFIQRPMAPAHTGPVSGIELEIYVARRFTSTTSGFNLNTWRACFGLGLRF